MGGTKRLLLLSLGLCLLTCYVSTVHLYGDSWLNPNQDMSGQLEQLKRQQWQLEGALARSLSYPKLLIGIYVMLQLEQLKRHQWQIEGALARSLSLSERLEYFAELQDVKASIAQMEAKLKVSYKDYLKTISGLRREFEEEKEELRKQLVDAESKRLQAGADLATQKSLKSSEVATMERRLNRLSEERNTIAKKYAEFTKAYHQHEQKMKEEREQFLSEKEKLLQSLDEAKMKHSQAVKALTGVPSEDYKKITIPEQDEIKKLRNDLTNFNGMADKEQLKEGLASTKTKLEELLDKLYRAGKFSDGIDHDEMGNALNEMEMVALRQREEQDKRRKGLIEKVKQKNITHYDEEEFASLQKTNEEMAALDEFQKEIARRGAYLKGILEVADLLKECSEAIRDANERNLAEMWDDAIQGAMDIPLVQVWVQSLQDAMDSDLARAWADALVDVRDDNVSQMWTDAIQETEDEDLAEVWSEAIKDFIGTPIAQMWSDAVQETPFGQFCSEALKNATNALCHFLTHE